MPGFVEGDTRTFRSSAALGENLIVKLDGSGQLELAGATDFDALGTTQREVFTADAPVAVKKFHAGCSGIFVSAGAIAVGAIIYQAANGRVDDSGSVKRGIALTATSGAGEALEVWYQESDVYDTTAE